MNSKSNKFTFKFDFNPPAKATKNKVSTSTTTEADQSIPVVSTSALASTSGTTTRTTSSTTTEQAQAVVPVPTTSSGSGSHISSATSKDTIDPKITLPELRKDDQVAKIRDGKLVLGTTLERPVKSPTGRWKVPVRWNLSDTEGVIRQYPLTTTELQTDLAFMDRALYKGCKVRRSNPSSGLVGVCRDVMVTADVRAIGTSIVIPSVNLDQFKHLKEFKQKSVVYKSGWLGVITDVKRIAIIRLQSGTRCEHSLNELLPVGPLGVEAPCINEEVDGTRFCYSKATFPTDYCSNDFKEKTVHTVFIENLKVESVNVLWRYQVDAMRPDRPPKELKGVRLNDLQIVMEEQSSEATFQVGNLGRLKIEFQTEFLSMEEFTSELVRFNLGEAALENLNPFSEGSALAESLIDRPSPGKVCVVEILRTSTTGDIIWQDGQMEFVSGTDLIIQDESLIDVVLAPGDFLYSTELANYGPPEKIYAVVSRYDLSEKQVIVKVLTCEYCPRVLQTNLCLNESVVIPHSRYKYFNQVNTVVVSCRDGRVGHVRRTNPDGKVQVLWYHNKREGWIWPAECSVYSVKGHDLECITSLVNEDDETKEVDNKTKFLGLVTKISSISALWNEVAEVETTVKLTKLRQQSLTELRAIILECRQIEFEVSKVEDKDAELFTNESIFLCSEEIRDIERKGFFDKVAYTKPAVVQSMVNMCSKLLETSDELLLVTKYFDKKFKFGTSSSTEVMDALAAARAYSAEEIQIASILEPSANSSSDGACAIPSSSGDSESEINIFKPNVVIEDSHPENHVYGKNTDFQPRQVASFVKVVRNELNNLRDQCPPGIKVKAYGSRFDLFSVLICGPVGTPYENSLYMFDAALPNDYPSVPPKFHFHSYSAGRLNPNLYAEGYVCVSLLGTWSGRNQEEMWTKDSTIVQVLLSIQALILVSEPYHNEPGHEVDKFSKPSDASRCSAYNTELIPKVMRMMINQIQHPMEPWQDEIRSYYKKTLPGFIQRWERWLASAASNPKTSKKPEFKISLTGKFGGGTAAASIQGQLAKLRVLHEGLMK